MKLTDALLGEHGVLYDLFDHLRDVSTESQDVGEIRAAFVAVNRLLLGHARIEEDMLFPMLEPHLGEMGPLAVMRMEHREIDTILEQALAETDIEALKSLAGRLIDLACGHFRKEEMVLFGMAQQCLGDAVLSDLGEQWASSRRVSLGGEGGGCMVSA